MKDTLTKLKQQALRSGLASAVHSVPGVDADHVDLSFVLKDQPVKNIAPRELKPGEKLEEGPTPVEQVTALLADAGLVYGEIRVFPAVRDAAVIVFDVGLAAPAKVPVSESAPKTLKAPKE